ncbi:hypothetical protein K2173_005738 [Erythroxylum novogranatense]|uniref:Uncharacterized protein n=1 Tax=Erythroxylum novogranatense TaxID=1862640 RepID=A0AAV8SQM7_9ROSI|nr:hypothetical protein K2173_005738 [Erythroxylum novogranatense]
MTNIEKPKDHNVSGDLLASMRTSSSDIEAALERRKLWKSTTWCGLQSGACSREKNKASAVALNMEIRRTKAKLVEEVPKLQRLAVNKMKKKRHLQSIVQFPTLARRTHLQEGGKTFHPILAPYSSRHPILPTYLSNSQPELQH